MEVAVILEIVNSVLLLALLGAYLQNYVQMKTMFGLGLVIFSLFLLVQNLLAVYFHFAMVMYYTKEVMQHAFFLSAAQTVALAVLAWVTYRG